MSYLLIALGIALLYVGGELLVRHASRLATAYRVSPLVIGLTVVAFGTSAPELATSLLAAVRGSAEIALGNVIGSNSANIGLILGLTALIYPLTTQARFVRREVPFMIGVGVLLVVILANGVVGRPEGALLLGLLALYLGVLLRGGERPDVEQAFAQAYGDKAVRPVWAMLGALLGLSLLVGGAQALVEGAVSLARTLGVSERVIGLTLVAVGTSLPELASSLIAALRRESDIVLGNLIGSNIFNVLGILGVTALAAPLALPLAAVRLDLLVMLGFSLLVLPFLATGLRLGRREGAVLLIAYAAYVAVLYSR